MVITTIHLPSPSVRAFADLTDWQVVIVGDRKTPIWPEVSPRLRFLDVDAQLRSVWSIVPVLPFNHYTRKNIGYLEAMALKVPLIADSDDDNAPLDGWGQLPESATMECVSSPDVVNIYRLFTEQPVWPRGLPLDLIRDRTPIEIDERELSIAVWQGLAAGDPDVDAIYRLVSDRDPEFVQRSHVALAPGVVAPMNSQNTIWHPEAFPYLYLPFSVSFRFTDILRGYVAQFGLHAMGRTVAFTSPTVFQERNEHDLLRDLADEVPVYTQISEALETMAAASLTGEPSHDLALLYSELERIGVVTADECRGVDAWLADVDLAMSA